MASKRLDYDGFMEYAKKHYEKGGDAYYECWDRDFFDSYVREFGPIDKKAARDMFRTEYAVRKDYEATAW